MLNARLVRWFSRKTPRVGTNSDIDLPIVLATDVGLVRNENQDRVAAMRVNTASANGQTFALIAVADGMGGMREGGECATRAISALFNDVVKFRNFPPNERLERAMDSANFAVNEYADGKGGATLSVLLVTADHEVWIANVGDSRIYGVELDESGKKVHRLTVDDTLAEVVGGHGHELLQFIGMGPGMRPHISPVDANIDRILITSDGVHFISPEILNDTFLNTRNGIDLSEQLLKIAKWRGAPDNASLATVSLRQLISDLRQTSESGVEVWDAFTGLHVMWLPFERSEDVSFANNSRVETEKKTIFHRSENSDSLYPDEDGSSLTLTVGAPKEGNSANESEIATTDSSSISTATVPRKRSGSGAKKNAKRKSSRNNKEIGGSSSKANLKEEFDLQLSLVDKQQED